MNATFKTILSTALLGMGTTATAAPVTVDVQVTADNAYAIYTGNETDIYDFHGTAENHNAGDIAAPETYSFSMDDGDIIYIAAWSDNMVAQGLLAEFNIDGTILTTGNSQWEVMATGIDLGFGSPAPTMAELTTQINLANSGMVPSGGWVNTTLGGLNDAHWGTPGSVHVPSMASTLQWAWYHKPGVTLDTFSSGYNHDEYLVFRLEFPIGGCCVDDSCYNMTPDDCDLVGGLYNDLLCEDSDWECPVEPDTGACCIDGADGATCIEVTELECDEQAGDWFGLGSACADVLAECEADPAPETGACCVDRPSGPQCVETSKNICKESEGIWYGWGSVCTDVIEECLTVEEPELGACCVKDECIESTEDDCEAWAGDFQGEGSSCLDVAVTCDTTTIDDHVSDNEGAGCSTAGRTAHNGLILMAMSMFGLALRRRSC